MLVCEAVKARNQCCSSLYSLSRRGYSEAFAALCSMLSYAGVNVYVNTSFSGCPHSALSWLLCLHSSVHAITAFTGEESVYVISPYDSGNW